MSGLLQWFSLGTGAGSLVVDSRSVLVLDLFPCSLLNLLLSLFRFQTIVGVQSGKTEWFWNCLGEHLWYCSLVYEQISKASSECPLLEADSISNHVTRWAPAVDSHGDGSRLQLVPLVSSSCTRLCRYLMQLMAARSVSTLLKRLSAF